MAHPDPMMFVPAEFRSELRKLPKHTILDIAWNIAGMTVESCDDFEQVMAALRKERDIVLGYRRAERRARARFNSRCQQ